MDWVILAKSGEIALKGLNRRDFEATLIKNIKNKINKYGAFKLNKCQSIIYITPKEGCISKEDVLNEVEKVFGIASINLAYSCEKSMKGIKEAYVSYFKESLKSKKTFKVEAKRSDKKFSLQSPEIQKELGEFILGQNPNLSVDVKNPEITIKVEVREKFAYLYDNQIKGSGGMPIGSCGNSLLLLSGGIDSPVAGFLMAKRGLNVFSLHFESPPYTSPRAKDKVVTLVEKMQEYTGNNKLLIANFTKIQEEIIKRCENSLFTVIMRRYMMKVAQRVCKELGCLSIITGESLGQVASQTQNAISCTDKASDLPVFRPLISFDKIEIVEIAKKIGTFETSILPYEDCCTVFTPKRPKTMPIMDHVLREEKKLDEENLICEVVKNCFENCQYEGLI